MTDYILSWFWVPLVVLAFIFGRFRQLRRPMVWGGSLAWPIVLIEPLTSVGFFSSLTTAQLAGFFISRAILAFSIGAISAAIYEAYLSPYFTRVRHSNRHHLFFLSVGPIIFLLLFLSFSQPLATSVALGVLANFVVVMVIRRDLFWDAAFAAIFFAVLYGLTFILAFNSVPGDVSRLWFTGSLSGLTLWGLPAEELIVSGLFGALWGPLYVALKGLKEMG